MKTIKHRTKLVLMIFAAFGVSIFSPIRAYAVEKGTIIIRDTEIENSLKLWTTPIFKAAGLDPSAVNIILVQSDEVNAFVAGGSNIFIYTGLISKAKNPDEVIGVLAHEAGHIAGGHLIRTHDAMEKASYESIVGMIVGIGAAIASGDAGAGSAISIGAGSMAQRRMLSHSRVQESSADQAALSFFDKAQMNPSGLLTFMDTLKSQIYMPLDQQTEYVLTHPLVENRIEALQSRVAASSYKNKAYPAEWVEQLARIKGKLVGFVNPSQVQWVYDDRDQSVAARYARSIAAYRNNQVEKALKLADQLLVQEPKNPYFLELKGQMLDEFGRGKEALGYYTKAVDILPEAGLIRIALAHVMIESGEGEEALRAAIKHLERAMIDEPHASNVQRFLATAYGRLGDENMAKVYLAEEAMMQQRFPYAKEQAEAVLAQSPHGSKAAVLAQDVLSFIETSEKK